MTFLAKIASAFRAFFSADVAGTATVLQAGENVDFMIYG
jgi:hypothetical protein